MTKATAGERWVLRYLMKMHMSDDHLMQLREFGAYREERMIANKIDSHAARERLKVAEDVLAMVSSVAKDYPNASAGAINYSIGTQVRAKYGKGKR